MKTILVLEDGSVYEGYPFGAKTTAYGEVVFNTSMTGYQEMLTDPSYAGQILVLTYPLIGNYGISSYDFESKRIQVRGLVVREECSFPSHGLSEKTLSQFLAQHNIPGIAGLDTRALTKKLRIYGVMMGVITSEMSPEEALEHLKSIPRYDTFDFVSQVSTDKEYKWEGTEDARYNLIVLDCGLKFNILRLLQQRGCRILVTPSSTSAEDILSLKPDGIILSPGPGNPSLLSYIEETVKQIVGKKPILGICLGHQILGRVFGADTFKLKFGHRGGNHPVKDLKTGRVYITAQNHGYAVDGEKLKWGMEVSQINLNDGTVEGLSHRELPIISIQYHPEASPGPWDNTYIFDRFLEMIRNA